MTWDIIEFLDHSEIKKNKQSSTSLFSIIKRNSTTPFLKQENSKMIRRQARLRREYLYRKGVEERQKAIQDKKDRLKRALEGKRR